MERIAALRVAVVGAGAVGARLVEHLARMGVAALTIVDRAAFKPESLLTQPILPGDVGKSKAGVVARRARCISPRTDVLAFEGPVQALDGDALHDADVVMLATDNLEAEIDVGQRCVRLGRPLIQASLHGESLTVEVRTFGNAPGGACPACGFTSEEWAHVGRGTRFACDPAAAPAAAYVAPPPAGGGFDAPTTSFGALCSLAADLAIVQLVRLALALGEPVTDRVVSYCGYTHATTTTVLERSASCPCDHRPLRVVTLPGPLGARSLAALIAHAAGAMATARPPRRAHESGERLDNGMLVAVRPGGVADRPNAVSVGGWSFVERARCACGATRRPLRFVAPGEDVGRCGACGRRLHAEPAFSHEPAPLEVVSPVAGRAVGALARRAVRFVVVWGDTGGLVFRGIEEPAGVDHLEGDDD